jgi:hypothetical protein
MLSFSGSEGDRQAHLPFVTEVGPDDVQLGRGRPVITSEGNQRFRALVLENKPEYSASNRHAHKDQIARRILVTIRERGGRFLRKIDTAAQRKRLGVEDDVDAWEIADDETSLNKVKQALREHDTAPDSKGEASTAGKVRASRKVKKDPASDTEVLTNRSDLSRSTGKRRKHESQVTTSVSLAESIRLNASKLGTDLSGESSYSNNPYMDTSSSSMNQLGDRNLSQGPLDRSQFQAIRETADRLNQAANELGIGKDFVSDPTERDTSIDSFARGRMEDKEVFSVKRRSPTEPFTLPQVTMPTSTSNILLQSLGLDGNTTSDSMAFVSHPEVDIDRALSANASTIDADDRKPEAVKPKEFHRK